MKSVKKLSGIALASAAATLLLASCGGNSESASAEKEAAPETATKVADIKCSGINACKGKSACGTADSACAGQNSCKGKGWIKISKEECDTKGGKVI